MRSTGRPLISIRSAAMSLIVTVALWALLPPEIPVDPKGKIDWIGSFLALGGLIVFNVVWK